MDTLSSRSNYTFILPEEQALIDQFLAEGMVIVPAENHAALEEMQAFLAFHAATQLGLPKPHDIQHFLNMIHTKVMPNQLNAFRLALLDALAAAPWYRAAYYATARNALATIVGNELVMQRTMNLSIQLPNDASSLLAIHADAWSGDSAYEVVLWIPYVDCYDTKSMYFCDRRTDQQIQANLQQLQHHSSEELYATVKDHVKFLNVPYGHVLLFTQNIMHGNRINTHNETRWSSNCRFKSALSPYADKMLGEFFEPITLRPATRCGLRYHLPEGFD